MDSIKYYEVNDMEVRGLTFRIYVSPKGYFSAVGPDGHTWSEHQDSRKELEADLMAKTKKAAAKVEVPFVRWDGAVKRGVATGIHAGTGNVTVRWADGKKEQITRDWSSSYLPPQDSTVDEKLAALLKAKNDAQTEYHDYLESLKTWGREGLKGVVERAVLEAMASGQG